MVSLLFFGFITLLIAVESAGLVTSERVGEPTDPAPSAEAIAGAVAPAESVHVVGSVGLLALGAAGLIGLILRPGQAGRAAHALASMIAVLAIAPVVGDPDNVGGQAGPVDPLFVVIALPGLAAALVALRPRRLRLHPDRTLLTLAGLGAVPLVWYGVSQALIQRNTFPPSADPHHNAHWWAMSAVALMVVLVVAVSGLGLRGWRIGAVLAGATGIAIGTASMLDGGAASTLGLPWSLLLTLWAAAVFSTSLIPFILSGRSRGTRHGPARTRWSRATR